MRTFLTTLLTLLIIPSILVGQECAPMPWLGVMLQSPPRGMERAIEMGADTGLEVESVVKEGPFALAGGKKGDLWWKFDDQILINTRQLLVLLRLKKVGEPVELKFYREGKLISKTVELGSRPHPTRRKPRFEEIKISEPSENAEREEMAEMKDGELVYQLTERGDNLNLLIRNEYGVIFTGLVNTAKEVEKLESQWRSSLLILRQALTVRAKPKGDGKKSRVRYLPRTREE